MLVDNEVRADNDIEDGIPMRHRSCNMANALSSSASKLNCVASELI